LASSANFKIIASQLPLHAIMFVLRMRYLFELGSSYVNLLFKRAKHFIYLKFSK